ncbi:MAG: thioesterase family protein [Rhodoferax sp.]
MSRPERQHRNSYHAIRPITTRWMDNDVYAHVNNVVYYAFFDTVVNAYLIQQKVLDYAAGEVIGLVVETGCHYFEPVAFPDTVYGGLRVAHMGTSSVRYEVGLFREEGELAAAQGHFVHVYVDRAQRRPTPLPAALRQVLSGILVPGAAAG